jgi:hypothetical protein
MTNENFQANNQATSQANEEAKTVINGKVVSLSAAQAAEQQAALEAQQTGIQAHHDNSSEAVQAGQTASNPATKDTAAFNIRQANVQSGQSHLDTNATQTQAAQVGYEGKGGTPELTSMNDTNAKLNAKAKTTKKAD